MHTKNNLGLIGAGYWGKNLARNFYELGALNSICDPNKDTNALLKKEYTEINIDHDYRNILNNSSIDRIAIAAPAELHYKLAKETLDANKDVFVEKPLCLNTKECRDLINLANSKNKVLMVGHLLHYHPCIEIIKNIINNGELGKLYYITSNRLNLGKIRKEENALWSFAPHDISVILSLVGNVLPTSMHCFGGAYLDRQVADTTLTSMRFSGDVRAHIHVSWLNPFKEQKLTIVGSEGMMVFDDTKQWNEKLIFFKKHLNWSDGQNPIPNKASGEFIKVTESEPLRNECIHYLDCCDSRLTPRTNGEEGLRVLETLSLAQKSLDSDGETVHLNVSNDLSNVQVHPSAFVDNGASIGEGTKVWHFSHICEGSKIGKNCVFGQNTMVAGGAFIGDNVKVQNNVSIYSGVTIEDDVFLGPSCVLTNVSNPRSQIIRKNIYEKTLIRKGASIGANSTIIPGVKLGKYSFISAGAVVTKNVPNYALMKGVPAKRVGWMSRHGHILKDTKESDLLICPESGFRYEKSNGELKCLDLPEDSELPEEQRKGLKKYRDIKNN